MKKLFLAVLALSLAFYACDNDKTTVEDTDNTDTTIIIHQNEPAEQKEVVKEKQENDDKPVVKEEPKPVETVNWRPLMDEYHQLLCRRHKGNPQPNDAIRQVELTKELNDAREKLSKEEKFLFATAMARAANMADCN